MPARRSAAVLPSMRGIYKRVFMGPRLQSCMVGTYVASRGPESGHFRRKGRTRWDKRLSDRSSVFLLGGSPTARVINTELLDVLFRK